MPQLLRSPRSYDHRIREIVCQTGNNLDRAPTVDADSGVENGNGQVDQLMTDGLVHRVLAQVEVSFSNSMIEAFWRSLRHQWLYLHSRGPPAIGPVGQEWRQTEVSPVACVRTTIHSTIHECVQRRRKCAAVTPECSRTRQRCQCTTKTPMASAKGTSTVA
jgi:hypothetical protein